MWNVAKLKRDFYEWYRRENGKSAGPGDFLESYVSYVYDSLLSRHARNITVTKQAQVPDNFGNLYNIDVFFEYEIAGNKHRVAIECKDHKRPVGRDDVIAFCGKVRDMPSTIGLFISASGFQSGALKYLDDHGVRHMTLDELPHFGQAVANRFLAPMLPDESASGQPFWTVMEAKNGKVTGSWLLLPWTPELANQFPDGEGKTVPLFWSRPEAERYQALWFKDGEASCVRGLEQPTLKVMIGLAKLNGLSFVVLRGIELHGRQQFICESWEPAALEDEFVSL
ncbi:restriction endonuclease [Arthrobacter sp. 2RAF22]|uniref:restriction endonuclease n=1 Tax=Arthrobacter sp. 2RAF22 TaxID=3232996 RepID=UPI003F937496